MVDIETYFLVTFILNLIQFFTTVIGFGSLVVSLYVILKTLPFIISNISNEIMQKGFLDVGKKLNLDRARIKGVESKRSKKRDRLQGELEDVFLDDLGEVLGTDAAAGLVAQVLPGVGEWMEDHPGETRMVMDMLQPYLQQYLPQILGQVAPQPPVQPSPEPPPPPPSSE